MNNRDIAIVGLSIYSPAGESVDEFWHGISGGQDYISEVPEDIIEGFYFEGNPNSIDSFYCNRGGFCRPFKIDPLRYGIMPITATGTELEHLVALAAAEQALIDAGVFEKGISLENGSVIIGKASYSSVVSLRSLEIVRMAHQAAAILKIALPDLTEEDLDKFRKAYQSKQGRYQVDMITGAMSNLAASLVANRFNLQGPAYVLDAACASGIISVEHSINLLRSGRCDIALAGGMHIGHSASFWGGFDMLGAMSRKQVIAPFSEEADGMLIGQGGGFLVLKTVEKAIRDEDRIYAVIKETSSCSDGAGSHVMVTSVKGQTRVLQQAWERSGLDPQRIGYVEGHGTGTIVGDRTEITTLKDFFGDSSRPLAYVGSIKSNVGHGIAAAGTFGIIKTALALYHRKIPPTIHCEKPLPVMFESRFLPPQELVDWDSDRLPLVAGVNAFGFGGINAHAILTAYESEPGATWRRPKPWLGEALMISAVDGPSLIGKILKGDYTNTGGDYRMIIFDPDEERLQRAVAIIEKDNPWRGFADIWFSNRPTLSKGGKIAFMFPGYSLDQEGETESLSEILDLPFLDDLIAESGMVDRAEDESTLSVRTFTAKGLYLDALKKLDVEADLYIGHSMGEWDAATFAGMTEVNMDMVNTNEAEWREKVAYPMVAVNGITHQIAQEWCNKIEDLYMVCDNCPSQVMLCGKEPAMEALMKILEEERLVFWVLPIGDGWHTPLGKGVVGFHEDFVNDIRVKPGRVPVWSPTTLELTPSNREAYLELIQTQFTRPILFRELIEKLYDQENVRVFIQISLGSLDGFVEDILKGKDFGAISTSQSVRSSADQFRRIMALLYIEGREVDPAFIGVKVLYRVKNSLITLPKGAPPIIRELPDLDDIVANRYGGKPGTGMFGGGSQGLFRDNLSELNHPIGAVADDNIREAIDVQRELRQIFGQYLSDKSGVLRQPELARQASEGQPLAGQPSARQASAGQPSAGQTSEGQPLAGQTSEGQPSSKQPLSLVSKPKGTRLGTEVKETLKLLFEDHPYLIDHAIIRQPKDWPVVEDLCPVVPLAMTLELIAAFAKKQAPDEKLIKIGKVSAFKWITVERPFEAVIKGKWTKENVLLVELGDNAKAECTFGEAWPEPSAEYDKEIDLGQSILDNCSVEGMYDRFSFHGPQYHSVFEQPRTCQRGMESLTKQVAGKGSLLDTMGQQLGLFLHLTQTENTISFPVRLKEVNFYGDIFDQEGIFHFTLIITKMTDSLIFGDMIYKRDGRCWCVARDYVCQRFEAHIPVWMVMLRPEYNVLSEVIAPGVCFYENRLREITLALLRMRYYSAAEREVYEKIESQSIQRENVVSCIALKDAARLYVAGPEGGTEGHELMYPIEFCYNQEEGGGIAICGNGPLAERVGVPKASVAYCGDAAAAVVASGPVGIGLARIDEQTEDLAGTVCTTQEMALLRKVFSSEEFPEAVLRLMVAKEAWVKRADAQGKTVVVGSEGAGSEGYSKGYEVETFEGDIVVINGERVHTAKLNSEYIVGWII